MNRLLTTGLMILCLSTATSIASDRQATPPPTNTQNTSNSATQTGQRIGTIISAAVDQAFPVIGKIMDLFKELDQCHLDAKGDTLIISLLSRSNHRLPHISQ